MTPMPNQIANAAILPTLGRIVLFTHYGNEAPAIVTRVHSPTCVNLHIFHDGGNSFPRTSVDKLRPDAEDLGVAAWRWPGEPFPVTTATGTASEPAAIETPPPPAPADDSDVPPLAFPAPPSDPNTHAPAGAN